MEDYIGLFHVDSNAIDDRSINTQSSFRNYTASTHRYSDDGFEAGLLEIHIPFSWVNLHKDSYIGVFDAVSGHLCRNGLIRVRRGYYPNIQSLMHECNVMFSMMFYGERFHDFFPDGEDPTEFLTYSSSNRRVEANVNLSRTKIQHSGVRDPNKRTVDRVKVRFTPQLAQLLGFDAYSFDVLSVHSPMTYREHAQLLEMKSDVSRHMPFMKVEWELEMPADVTTSAPISGLKPAFVNHIISYASSLYSDSLMSIFNVTGTAQSEPRVKSGIEELFIYSTLIKHTMIGNSFKQLLRVTPVFPPANINRGEPIVLTYERPYYFPLFDTSFDYIELELRDRGGQLVEFESGSVVAVLEVRRKKNGTQLF